MLLTRMLQVVALASVLVLVGAGCGDSEGDEGGGVDGQVLAAAESPRLNPEPAAVPGVAGGTTAFATDLYAELAGGDGNLVFSPHSVAIALAMTRAGAAGISLDELTEVLHLGGVADPDAGFNALDQALAGRSGTFTRFDGSEAELTLRIANALWGQRGTTFKDPFLERLAEFYGAGMRLVDYAGDVEGARQEINAWVADRTEDRIEDLIPAGALTPVTRLVLTNAVYLLAPWEMPFAEDGTSPGPFRRLDGTEVQAALMQLSESLPYGVGDGWQAVELPYAGGDLSMLVIVPDAGGFERIEGALSPELLAVVDQALAGRQVMLRFPRFEFRTQAGLGEALRALGLIDSFDPDRADFSPMTDEEKLFIADVIHEAFIAVDEEGTEAAAATAVVMAATAAPEEPVALTVDRPFIFAIRDVPTGAVLFLGRVADPTA